jgi:sterol desaturase/sphingolipid hydroxylase (fatty acid hydroxylase superfamily)
MELWFNHAIRLAGLLLACALLWSVEALVPLFRYRPGRWRRIAPNLELAFLVVATNAAVASVTMRLCLVETRHHWGLLARVRSHSWLLMLVGIAALDLFAYLAHRLLHAIPFAWRFHRVHHSELEVDVTTAFRQHPLETLWRIVWQLLPTAILGLPFWVVALYLSLSSASALWEHANISIGRRLEAWLRLVIVTPNMHKIHHSRRVAETDSNYSNILSLWDRLGRTYTARAPDHDFCYGLEGFDDDKKQTVGGLLRLPF